MPERLHTIRPGEDLQILAQRYFGNPARYMELYLPNRHRLRSGNPDTVFPGEQIVIPASPDEVIESEGSATDDDFVLTVGGRQLSGFEHASVTRHMDTVADTYACSCAYSPPDVDLGLKPFGYERVSVSVGKDLILTGRNEMLKSTSNTNGSLATFGGRSLPGPIVDCSVTERPYEYRAQALDAIAETMLRPSGLEVVFANGAAPGPPFAKAVVKHGQTPFAFLSLLANQRGLLLTSNAQGAVVFTQANVGGDPIANIVEGEGSFLSAVSVWDATGRYSDVTIEGHQRGGAGLSYGVATDSLVLQSPINRALVLRSPSAPEEGSLESVAKWERSKRAASSGYVVVTLEGWRRMEDGELWAENEVVVAQIPRCFIPRATRMVIRSVTLHRTEAGSYTDLALVLPDAYTLEPQEEKPW